MILSCGDALIDFVPLHAADGREAVRPAVGGSCLNVAVGLARLGTPTAFAGGISSDMFGRMIADHASASGVDLSHATRSDHQTTLAFARVAGGETQYAFYDAQTASANWVYRPGAIPLGTMGAVHIGSTTLVSEKGASEVHGLLAGAKDGPIISFDPNARPSLVRERNAYVRRMNEFAMASDIVKMSDVDFEYLYGDMPYGGVANVLLAAGCSFFVVTRGSKGALAWHGHAGALEVTAPAVDVVDTIGAGDSFQSGLLCALYQRGLLDRTALGNAIASDLHSALEFACRCAAVTCGRKGADPPWRRELGSA